MPTAWKIEQFLPVFDEKIRMITEGIGFLLVKAVHFGARAAQKSNPSETSVVLANDVRLYIVFY